jgi:hypothetical protein
MSSEVSVTKSMAKKAMKQSSRTLKKKWFTIWSLATTTQSIICTNEVKIFSELQEVRIYAFFLRKLLTHQNKGIKP